MDNSPITCYLLPSRFPVSRAETGDTLLTCLSQAMTGFWHFQVLIATQDRLYVAADWKDYGRKTNRG